MKRIWLMSHVHMPFEDLEPYWVISSDINIELQCVKCISVRCHLVCLDLSWGYSEYSVFSVSCVKTSRQCQIHRPPVARRNKKT